MSTGKIILDNYGLTKKKWSAWNEFLIKKIEWSIAFYTINLKDLKPLKRYCDVTERSEISKVFEIWWHFFIKNVLCFHKIQCLKDNSCNQYSFEFWTKEVIKISPDVVTLLAIDAISSCFTSIQLKFQWMSFSNHPPINMSSR